MRPRRRLRVNVVLPVQVSPQPWRWRHLFEAPHRVSFFMATLLLLASAAWWGAIQLQRGGVAESLPLVVPASLVHSVIMTFGFIPLFFAGFLFTAGPRWLGVAPPDTRLLLPALSAQLGGGLIWLAASHVNGSVAAAGLALALGGLCRTTMRFCRMAARSTTSDRTHAIAIGCALVVGCACLAGVTASVVAGTPGQARLFVLTGLWEFVVAIYLTVAHRMIPFLTSDAMPVGRGWHPAWMLWPILGGVAFEASAVWVDHWLGGNGPWQLVRGSLEIIAGAGVVALAFTWGRVQSLKVRLLAMLHLGFLWLGFALLLGGATQMLGWATGSPVLRLAALHALTMGCLGSLMLAMVTRVSCGHSGRPLVADNLVWSLFWLLQVATLLRISAAVPMWPAQALLIAASLIWAAVMMVWGIRHGSWYGRGSSR